MNAIAAEVGFLVPVDASRFYSPFISSAQRLPNGNTLITEGSGGRMIEVTADHRIVWEYISPYWGNHFWARGYFVNTVGLDEEMIRKYVKYQEKEEKRGLKYGRNQFDTRLISQLKESSLLDQRNSSGKSRKAQRKDNLRS